MEFLTTVFGNLTSGIIRLGVAVGILAAVYFFLLKPVLQTTEKTVEGANQSFEKSFETPEVNVKAMEARANKAIEDMNRQVQAEVQRSFHTSKVHGSPEKLLHCIQRANTNVQRIERCTRRY